MILPLRVLVVGCGHMGGSHARAYQRIPEFQIAGLVSRTSASRESLNRSLGGGYALFSDYLAALIWQMSSSRAVGFM
jgi:predicted dehydrogenase